MTEAECMIIDTSDELLKTCKSPDEDVPPAKKLKESDSKLKQARLPFKPLDQKPQLVPSSTPPGSKKRKHSDGESPCAKPPKTAKSVTVDKPVIVENDPEVSSSSEAENIPQQSLKTRVRNTLERFIRRQSQDEITSTNQCIDLTDVIGDEKENDQKDSDDKDSDVNKENELKSKLKTGDGEKDKSESKVVRVSQKENKKNKQEKCEADKVQEDCQATGVDDKATEGNDNTTGEDNKATEGDDNTTGEDNKATGEDDQTTGGDKKENVPEMETPEEEQKDLDISMEASDDDNEKTEESGENVQNCNISDASTCSDQQTPAKSKPCDANLGTPVSAKLSDSLLRTPVSDSTPGRKTTPSSQSPGNSCSDGTPKTSAKNAPRMLSDSKKKERELLRNKIKEEKEKEREEKKRQKEQERLEKEKQKEKLKKEREEAKAEKDKQRKEEKEKKEKERLEKLQQKEEEKRKKQDLQDAKMEEKKKKEEEKQKEEEEKKQKEMKSKEKFTSFFIKQKTSPVSKPNKENSGLFMPFELKKDMMLAPCFDREGLSEDRKMNVDEALQSQDKSKSELYLAELTKDQYKPVKTEKTSPMEMDNDVMLVHDSETVKKITYHCKLLQFHTNYRPPYYGTWRKKSKVVTPRNPFKTDSDMLDYEVDSDDEWEEEEPGESLSASEGEEEKEENNSDEEEEDGWMVPHGYLSEDEGCEADEEVTPEMLKARRKAKADQWECELKRQTQPAIHTIIGCFWEHAAQKIQKDLEERLKSYRAVCVGTVEEPIPTTFTGAHLKKGDNSNSDKRDDSRIHAQRKPVPEEAIPDLIRLVHGNLVGIKKLVREFRLYWKQKTSPTETDDTKDVSMDVDESENNGNPKGDNTDEKRPENESGKDDNFAISKRQLEMKISSIAMREKRESYKKICWYVHESVQQQYSMTDLPVPSKWEFISQPHKTPTRPKPEDTPGSGRKTPTPTVERKTPTVSITQFAKPMSPSTLQAQFAAANAAALAEKQRIAEEQAAKLAAQNAASNTSNTVNAVVSMDCTEASQPKKDQKSIKDFAKNIFSPPKTHEWKMVRGGSGSPRDGKRLVLISNSFTSPKPAVSAGGSALTNTQKNSPKCSNSSVKSFVSKVSPSVKKITSSPRAESNSTVASKNRVIPVHIVDSKSGSTAVIDFSHVDSDVSSTTSNIQPSRDDNNCHGKSVDDAIVLD